MSADQVTAVQPARETSGPHDTAELSFFDRFASAANHFVSRALFFSLCLLLVVIWLPSYFLFGSVDTWQLIINTITTIVTFLLVALLQNTQTRADAAIQQKLNAIADGLADLMEASSTDNDKLRQDTRELRQAVGLEKRQSA
jgi:low affinity Fe/Cu permease